jgi:hypothetical protein
MLLALARAVFLATIFYYVRLETSFSSPPTTRRVTVEVFDPASARVEFSDLSKIKVKVKVRLRLTVCRAAYIVSIPHGKRWLLVSILGNLC